MVAPSLHMHLFFKSNFIAKHYEQNTMELLNIIYEFTD